MKINHKFVDNIPEFLEKNTIYVSIKYSTSIHSCCCGCGNEVVTPLSRNDWKLTFDGESVSLYPSIGNWNFPCKSHYWINQDQIQWERDSGKRSFMQEVEVDEKQSRNVLQKIKDFIFRIVN